MAQVNQPQEPWANPENPYAAGMTPGQGLPPESPEPELSSKVIGLVVGAVVLAAVIVGVVAYLIFAGGGSDSSPSLANAKYKDGQLMTVTNKKLVLFTGAKQMDFKIRPDDARNINIAHAQSHANIGTPTRVYYEKKSGTLYAIGLEDAPKPE
jgi:hypothetical protein